MMTSRRVYAKSNGRKFRTGKPGIVPVSSKQAEENLAKKVVRLERMVKAVKPEVKIVDNDTSATNVDTTNMYSELISNVAGGTSVNQRVGFKIRVTGFEVNVLPVIDATSVDVAQANAGYRILVVQNLQITPDLATMGFDQIFDQAARPWTALYTSTQQNFVKILYDSGPITLNAASVATYGGKQRDERYWRRIKRKCNIVVEFNGTAAADVQKNGLYVCYISNCLVTAASSLDIVGTSRVMYTDL